MYCIARLILITLFQVLSTFKAHGSVLHFFPFYMISISTYRHLSTKILAGVMPGSVCIMFLSIVIVTVSEKVIRES